MSESGIAVALISAVRQSNRKTTRTATTRIPPSARAWRTWPVARATNSAGRKRSSRRTMPSLASPGRSSASAASTPAAASTLLAPYCAPIIIRTPGLPSTRAALIAGSGPSTTSATSPSTTLAPPSLIRTVRATAAGVTDCPSVCRVMRWLTVSMKPAPRTPVALRPAASTSVSPMRKRTRSRGRTWMRIERTSPP